MSKWKYTGRPASEDKLDRVGKIRKRKNPKKKVAGEASFDRDEAEWAAIPDEGWFAARVVEVHKRYAFVSPEPEPGRISTRDVWLVTIARRWLALEKTERNLVAVGDRVLIRPSTDKDEPVETDLPCGIIEYRAPRLKKIRRCDPANPEIEHVLAANVDQLVVVASYLQPKIRWGLLDRYLLLAEEQELDVLIVLNKRDLLEAGKDEKFRQVCEQQTETYRGLGYKVVSFSALKDGPASAAAEEIRASLENRVSIFSGHSGVGKSSIVNLFRPEIVQEVEPNAEIFYKGRHTTTYASMIKLGTGGFVVDTPGIRSFVVGKRTSVELAEGFREIRALRQDCKFRECRHIDEPECAVLAALADGRINPLRYKSFKAMMLGESGREGRFRD